MHANYSVIPLVLTKCKTRMCKALVLHFKTLKIARSCFEVVKNNTRDSQICSQWLYV